MISGKALKTTVEEYNSIDAVRNTELGYIARSPAHYIEYKKNPPASTANKEFGIDSHVALLQPDLFKSEYVIAPKFDKRTKAGKEEFEKFLIENNGKRVIEKDAFDAIQGMIDSVYTHPAAKKLLSLGHAELTYLWRDQTGLDCKVRPDFLRDGNLIVDIKTTENGAFKPFQKSIANYRYHVQGAFYCDGVSHAVGSVFDKFVIIAVEKKPPYAVAVYALDEATLDCGRSEYRENLDLLAECKEKNHWPAYSTEVQPMNIPPWAWKDVE